MHNETSDGINASMNEGTKLKFYFEEYFPFVKESKIKDLKKMDEAFFAFGQFINLGNQKMLVV
jgi:DNA primase catalytic subunit